MSDDKLLEDRRRAALAQDLLQNELLNEAFDYLKDAYVGLWQATAPSDQTAREKLYLAVNVIGKVRQHLEVALVNGKLADAELKQLADEQERKRRFRVFGS